MKYYIAILMMVFMVVSVNCYSQIELLNNRNNKVGYDTVKCILLVCDTSVNYYYKPDYHTYDLDHNNYKQDTVSYISNYVWWINGYEVEIIYPSGQYGDKFYFNNPKVTIGYLDSFKKPLSKNIIVWQSKYL